ncbi:MAG TPA: LuxR C-terminal-related transcriptional regulator, partial [Gaiellaceae bacterium]|nr:LuxR C-terminal-related transcriptional regulator [Gaiellaceae bacterium]
LRFIAEAESIGGDQPFTTDLLAELGRLVPGDSVVYSELDRVRRRILLKVDNWPDDEDDGVELDDETFWRVLLEEHPLCLREQEGHFDAVKLSDFLTQRELHRTWVYDNFFAPYDVEYSLEVSIPSPLWHTKTFLFNRSGGPDFTERDRLVLNLLQPHLARIWLAARTRRLLSAALAELDRIDEHDPRGVILLGLGGEIEFASPPTQRLLREFFPARSGRRLPAALVVWLESGETKPLIRRRGERRLTVQQADGALLLEEKHEGIELTAREREVLAWVARGKTNAEIARRLWLAPSTVGKHLENIYTKLGVSTRTAAVAHCFGLSDADAS